MHDIVIFGDDVHGIVALKDYLSTHFYMKDLSNLRYFLGIEVAHSLKGLSLSQWKYLTVLLTKIGYVRFSIG